MTHIISVHVGDKWLEIQKRFIMANIPGKISMHIQDGNIPTPHKWASMKHAHHLNCATKHIIGNRNVGDSDLLMVLDSDAFPIRKLDHLFQTLRTTPLIAVQRAENGDYHTHPSCVITTVGFWRGIFPEQDESYWNPGNCGNAEYPDRIDTGGRLYQHLRKLQIEWTPLRRTNTVDFAPVLFGIYGGTIYHHGAGSRKPLVFIHHKTCDNPERANQMAAMYENLSSRVFDEIVRNPEFFKEFEARPSKHTRMPYIHPDVRNM